MADWIVWGLATLLVIFGYIISPTLGLLVGVLVVLWALAWFGGYMPASLD